MAERMKIEDWNKLNSDQQKLVAEEEIPQTIIDRRKNIPQLTAEEIQGLKTSITDLTTQLGDLKTEKTGIYTDLKKARDIIKDLNEKVKTLEAGGGGAPGADEDFPTIAKTRALIVEGIKELKQETIDLRTDVARDRELVDERVMKARTDLPIPYSDAIKVFVVLAKANPTFYKQVQEEGSIPGGRPAHLAYKIALREHPEFVQKVKELGAQEIIANLTKIGKLPKVLPAGGAGGGEPDVNEMSIEQLMALPDDKLDKIAKEGHL